MEIENNVKVVLYLAIHPQVHFTCMYQAILPFTRAVAYQLDIDIIKHCMVTPCCQQYIHENNSLMVD